MTALRHGRFRWLIAGQLVSNLGDAIFSVALPWYVLAHHGGVVVLAGVLTAYGIPRTALLLLGGHASDRYRPWMVMLVANAVRGVAVTAFALGAAIGFAHGLPLIVIAVALGAGEGVFIPASSAIIPSLLARDELQVGNGISFGTTELTQLAGPALGGILIAVIRPAGGFVIDAVTFAVSAATLLVIRRRSAPVGAAGHRTGAPGPGVSTVWKVLRHEPILRCLLLTDAILNLGSAGMSRVALAALARGPLHLGADGYGLLVGALGAGLLIGTLTGSRLPPSCRPLRLASFALLPAVPLIALIPYAGGLAGAILTLIGAFGLIAIANLLLETSLQQWAPPQLLGRLTGLLMLASVGMFPVSVLLAGVAITLTGPALYFPIAAATVLVAATIQLGSSAWRQFSADQPLTELAVAAGRI